MKKPEQICSNYTRGAYLIVAKQLEKKNKTSIDDAFLLTSITSDALINKYKLIIRLVLKTLDISFGALRSADKGRLIGLGKRLVRYLLRDYGMTYHQQIRLWGVPMTAVRQSVEHMIVELSINKQPETDLVAYLKEKIDAELTTTTDRRSDDTTSNESIGGTFAKRV